MIKTICDFCGKGTGIKSTRQALIVKINVDEYREPSVDIQKEYDICILCAHQLDDRVGSVTAEKLMELRHETSPDSVVCECACRKKRKNRK